MDIYKRLFNELKLEVWDQAAMVPGMHFFVMRVDDVMRHYHFVRQTPNFLVGENKGNDTSVWRRRLELKGVDASSRRVMMNLFNSPSSKRIPIVRTRDAFILCDHDMVCIRFQGFITATWLRPLRNPELLRGIKRVSIEYERLEGFNPTGEPSFRCYCDDATHRWDKICPVQLDKFISYFPDLEQFYIIKKFLEEDLNDNPGGRRNIVRSELSMKKRKEVSKKYYKDTYLKLRGIARRENLANFEDTKNFYYEIRESDTTAILDYGEIWNAFHGLKALWERQKRTPNLGHEVKEVELGILVQFNHWKLALANPPSDLDKAEKAEPVKAKDAVQSPKKKRARNSY
ncbi:hypothetical protein F4805DRAFT_455513 [Annulohypoxylon moriforme]|nr:hypothetical protein F4805DRAFT_455513 [Annulohypoxylon moriforme]